MAVKRRPRRVLIGVVAAAVVAIDQVSKTWAEHHLRGRSIHVWWTLRLRLTFNPGIAFSLGRGATTLVSVVALVVAAALLVLAWHSHTGSVAVALGLVLGGAVGNLTDRFLRSNGGRVIDFIDLRWWPVFNVADAAITCGVILALVAHVVGP